ncbi:hypothetical protein DOO78_06965 [Roseicella frigidaeris]|uniref:SH3b domain-containing protein n=2 Tax=Roseicella frigidaeris TaxID=2230885 RepID=A0A327MC34_9PROT|nr:hypothetical protein DOO78_06965 [Roseicella frigidaeris]
MIAGDRTGPTGRRGRPGLAWVAAAVPVLGLVAVLLHRMIGAAPPSDWSAIAEAAGREAVAQALPAGEASPDWRELVVYRFNAALEEERGVCGRVLAGPRTGGTWADFAVRVRLERPASGSRPATTSTEVFLADGPGGMRALYLARQRFCRDATASPPVQPAPTTDAPPPAAPPMAQGAPAGPAAPAAVTSGAPAAAPAEGGGARPAAPVLGRIAVRSPVNLRTGPGGGASVIGVLPRGKTLDILERAPGGWMRVGDPAPLGWVHASLVQTLE